MKRYLLVVYLEFDDKDRESHIIDTMKREIEEEFKSGLFAEEAKSVKLVELD